MTPVPRAAVAFYRALLRLYPRELREDVGDEMLALFRDRWREERGRGRLALAGLVARTLLDVLRNAPAEWLRPDPEKLTMDALLQDLRFAVRSLWRRPGFLVVAVLTLALGVGANTAIFGIVHATLLRPLPYPDEDRLVMVASTTETSRRSGTSYPELLDWRQHNRSFEALVPVRGQSVNLTGAGDPERLIGAFVGHQLLGVLGAPPLMGRDFRPEECEPATHEPVAILNYHFWQRRFGADPALLGTKLVLNGRSHTVIGIVGPELHPDKDPPNGWFHDTDVWMPLPSFPNARGLERGQNELAILGKLRPGVTPQQAEADLTSITQAAAAIHPEEVGRGAAVIPLRELFLGDVRPPILILFGAVGLVLLIACVNVANLLLARASQREKELAVRAALGAGRRRLVRQLLTESLLLGVFGGLAGLAVSVWALKAFVALAPASADLPSDVAIDVTVMLYTLAIALGTALLFGVVPALKASRPDVNGALKNAGPLARGHRFRDGLVIAEAALSLMLLVGAGLLLRSAMNFAQASPGFRTDHLLQFQFRLPPSKYATPDRIAAMFRAAQERLEAVPGVESAALARAAPFSGNQGGGRYTIVGQPPPPPGKEPAATTNLVSPGWFRTLGIPLLAGRDFDATDVLGAPPVAVINEWLARRAWPGENPIGKRLHWKDTGELTVIGVVGDIRHGSLSEEPQAQIYAAHAQFPMIFTAVVVRTVGDPLAAIPAVRQAIWSVDPEQPMWQLRSMEQSLERHRAPSRSLGLLTSIFAGVAVVLSGIGLYGVMSYAVAQRTREIGIRIALGAPAGRVIGDVVGRGMLLAAAAVVLGVLGAAALQTVLRGLLWGVGTMDPLAIGGAALVLLGVSFVAAYVPARRAARVDPVIALGADGQ
jgi:putative ABC transport system permease protein